MEKLDGEDRTRHPLTDPIGNDIKLLIRAWIAFRDLQKPNTHRHILHLPVSYETASNEGIYSKSYAMHNIYNWRAVSTSGPA